MDKKVRVRFAPSPTGPLHIGGVRTALYNYLFAKKNGGDFILRIEDTDQKRYVEGAEAYIISALKWLGLSFDEGPEQGGEKGPYRQSERNAFYKEHIAKLLQKGNVYYAFDSAEDLAAKRAENPNWTYNASVRGEMKNSISLREEETKQLLDSGAPFVIRTKIPENRKEWLSSAALHEILYEFSGWTAPIWVHLPLILKPNGKGKLSKRDGELGNFPVFPLEWEDPTSNNKWMGFKEEGYFPEALVNILALLGWNPGTEEELLSLEKLVEAFSLDRINNSGARFDPEKAKWFNKEYLQMQTDESLVAATAEELITKGLQDDSIDTKKIVLLMKDRSHFASEIANVGFLFNAPEEFHEKTLRKKWKEATPSLLKEYSESLSQLADFNQEKIEEHFKAFLEEKEVGMFGKEKSVNRISQSIAKIDELHRS